MQVLIRERLEYLHKFMTYPKIAWICGVSGKTIYVITMTEEVIHQKTLKKIQDNLRTRGADVYNYLS